ncbi:DUF6879 family protein [Kitasatospora kifunensis]|uniref:DUF6879 domain-containing protein n=1 Tax=Kitasatospora kifunensis TaxID=58351 RepID=A0A7W7R5P2_KITKI|nr:DUF6879 family protein [Kitasatospora kifunensis]MBB4925922.1 hypothetical protein [Kitasatospora kifunensis]
MPDPLALELDPALGDQLTLAAYEADFDQRDAQAAGRDSWKFERQQNFQEFGNPSWEAFHRGDWDEALRLVEDQRDMWLRSVREDQERGSVFRRVRVVEEPLAPYVQWELHVLRLQAQCGVPVRIVRAEALRPLEAGDVLPEVVVLAGRTLYQVHYTRAGRATGAIRYTDPRITEYWEEFIKELHATGEDVICYVDRYVSQLPPPRSTE